MLLAGGLSAAEVSLSADPALSTRPGRAVAGQAIRIEVTGLTEEADLEAVHRPGSAIPRVETLGTVSPGSTLTWTPLRSGLVRLRLVSSANAPVTLDLAIHAETPAPAAVVTLLFAGLVLFGGAAVALRRHLAHH